MLKPGVPAAQLPALGHHVLTVACVNPIGDQLVSAVLILGHVVVRPALQVAVYGYVGITAWSTRMGRLGAMKFMYDIPSL